MNLLVAISVRHDPAYFTANIWNILEEIKVSAYNKWNRLIFYIIELLGYFVLFYCKFKVYSAPHIEGRNDCTTK